MVSIDKAFNPETKSIYEHYQNPGVGFYIPLYQREYSWDNDNIDQLLDDVTGGIESLVDNPKGEIRFLGTIIAVTVRDKRSIYPIDPQGLPSSIENIIDGQQRLSTIALFTTLLYKHIKIHHIKITKLKNLSDEELALVEQLEEACNYWLDRLIDIFSLDLKRGKPYRKPKIIRGNKDQWTKDGDIEPNYVSEIAKHIAQFIEYCDNEDLPQPKADKSTRAGKNLSRIERWLKRAVIPAHEKQTGEFIPAWDIISKVEQEDIWQYERKDLAELVQQKEISNKRSLGYFTCSLVHLFAVSHYLLDRCCFTIIQPMNEDWAFDMFQSLNATGTPLTAIETFKPLVVNTTDSQQGVEYKNSDAEKSFDKIDALFADTKSASQKSKLANEFLTSFALTVDGYKLGSHFSKQRRWLNDTYNKKFSTFQEQKRYIHFFGNYAKFYRDVWIDYKGENAMPIDTIQSHPEAELASLLILYLRESNHKMAITILGRFYSDVLDGKENSVDDFVEACKVIAAFYTLWRSAESNAGLDNAYRAFFRGEGDSITKNDWITKGGEPLDLATLKQFLTGKLAEKGIENKDAWMRKAINYLSYNKSKSVCKFTLFVTAHETIPDSENKGLMKAGVSGTEQYLILKKWTASDFKTIEHVAPQTQNDFWDEDLYDEQNNWYQSIGNLTLLPSKVNTSAGNRGWEEKYLYYQFLGEKDPQRREELKNWARSKGISLSNDTLVLLQNSNYNDHIKAVVNLRENGKWNVEFVKKRAKRMLKLLYNKVSPWL